MNKLLSLAVSLPLLFSPLQAEETFEGFYCGPALHFATEQHSVSHPVGAHSVGEDRKDTHNQVAAVLGYGKTLPFDGFPIYVGLEAYIPLKGGNVSAEIESIINNVRSRNIHEMNIIFPKEGAFKVGIPIDDKVLLFAKVGMVHQKMVHKVSALRHTAERSGVHPLFGAGLTFAVNGKWLLNGEYTIFKTDEHKKLLFGHKMSHQRFNVTVAYRF